MALDSRRCLPLLQATPQDHDVVDTCTFPQLGRGPTDVSPFNVVWVMPSIDSVCKPLLVRVPDGGC